MQDLALLADGAASSAVAIDTDAAGKLALLVSVASLPLLAGANSSAKGMEATTVAGATRIPLDSRELPLAHMYRLERTRIAIAANRALTFGGFGISLWVSRVICCTCWSAKYIGRQW